MGRVRHLRDACTVGLVASADNGNPTPGYSYGAEIRCKYWQEQGRAETMDGSHVPKLETKFALPDGTTIESDSRISLTKLNGTAVGEEEIYRVIGEPWLGNRRRGGSQVIVKCELISGGSSI